MGTRANKHFTVSTIKLFFYTIIIFSILIAEVFNAAIFNVRTLIDQKFCPVLYHAVFPVKLFDLIALSVNDSE